MEDVSESEKERFWQDGFLIVRGAFTTDEMDIVRRAIRGNEKITQHLETVRKQCQEGHRRAFETIFVWNDTAGDDLFSLLTRSTKIFDRLEHFFDDEIYDYHNKIPVKEPGVIGFPFHQDYAYWYGMGNLYPDMATVFIAIDDADRENGCLRLLRGSHKMGRIDHDSFDGVPTARLQQIKTRHEEVVVELQSGDLVMFHGNTLHGSADNHSEKARLALLGTYNTKHNSPYETHCGHPTWHRQTKFSRPLQESDIARMPDFDLHHQHTPSEAAN